MLEVKHVIRKSSQGFLDTVYFFERTLDLVNLTKNRIPGANGFPGEFTEVVLADDPDGEEAGDLSDPLLAPSDKPDTAATRRRQVLLTTRRDFIRSFPFDVINLDLEGYLLRPTEQLPGRLINSLRKVFAWQRRSLLGNDGKTPETLESFALMFTTKIGPGNLSDDYLQMLRQYVRENVTRSPDLGGHLQNRFGTTDLPTIEAEHFDGFFRLAAPKLLAKILDAEDWFVDPDAGMQLYEFERPTGEGNNYKMLHLVMHVRRKHPPVEKRPPGQDSAAATEAYARVVARLFNEPAVSVTDQTINKEELQNDLDEIKEHRRRVYPEGERS